MPDGKPEPASKRPAKVQERSPQLERIYIAAMRRHRIHSQKLEAFDAAFAECTRRGDLPDVPDSAPSPTRTYELLIGRLADAWRILRPSMAEWSLIIEFQRDGRDEAAELMARIEAMPADEAKNWKYTVPPINEYDLQERMREDRAMSTIRDYLRRCSPAIRQQTYLYIETLEHEGGGVALFSGKHGRHSDAYRPGPHVEIARTG